MLAASQRRFDLILFWKLDRFSREGARATLRLLTILDSYGCQWRSFMEPFFDSCGVMRDVVISIMATLGEQERIAISERTKAGLQRAVKAGRVLGRRAVVVDIACARKLQKEGLRLRPIAKQMRVSVNTLARPLRKAA
jgi:DNA invertase Pin-like site-specific DNA recombinase